MVPKIAGKGASFKGAGLYYLHDKNADTKERVAFTHTENLPTDDAELAIRLMARTAINQGHIKAANDNTVKTGRKLQKPVYAYSLSWSPDEPPTPSEMIEAARETLDLLGLQGHQVLMVSHNDEPHPHIHVIVNRVHPETGLAAKLSMDRLKLSRWAENYERTHGQIRCKQRVENNARRRRGQFVKDLNSRRKAQYLADRKLQLRQTFQRRQMEEKNLSAYHTGQRQALYDQKETYIKEAREAIRANHRPKWAEMYRRHRAEKRELNEMQKSAYLRLRYFLKQHGKDTTLRIAVKEAIRAMFGRDNPHAQLTRKHEAERKALAAEIRAANLAAIREENRVYRRELAQLERIQRGETFSLRAEHARQSQQGARAIKQQADERERDSGAPQRLSEEFRKRVEERIRKARKRDDRGKGHGRERDS